MTWLRRPRFKNHSKKIKVSKPSSKLEKNTGHDSNTSNSSSIPTSSSFPQGNTDNNNSTLRKKAGRRFFFFAKKSNARSLSPNTITTDDVTSMESHDTTHTDALTLTTSSRKVSWSSSIGNSISPQQKGEISEFTINSERNSWSSSQTTKLAKGRGRHLSSTGSVDSTQSDRSNLHPLASISTHSDNSSFHRKPMNKDLSLEDLVSALVLPSDLSIDLESLALEMQHEGNESCQSIENELSDVPIEVNTELQQVHLNSSRSTITDLESLLQVMPDEDDELHQSIEDLLRDTPYEIDDKLHQHEDIEPRQSANNAPRDAHIELDNELRQIRVNSKSPAALSTDLDYTLLLDGSDFDSNYDSNSETISETHSSEKGRVTKSIPYQCLDDMSTEDQSLTSTDSSQHSVNLPLELQNDHMVTEVEDDSNRDSEVATALPVTDISHLEETFSDICGEAEVERLTLLHPISSNEEESDLPSGIATASYDTDISHLEELYSNIFGKEEEKSVKVRNPISSNDEKSDPSRGTISTLPLFRDSSQSSMMSFESAEFREDEQLDDGESKACCSITTHDIKTIHEENEDDIAKEVYLLRNEDEGIPKDQNILRMRMTSQGTAGTGTISTVTDDSYTGGMSVDSLSSGSEQGNYSRSPYRKILEWKDGGNINTSKHVSFANVQTSYKPVYQQPELSFESSLVSFTDSACSDSDCSYDSLSSKSVKYMVDVLKEEAKRRRSKMKDRIAKLRESTDTGEYASRIQ